jgi:hypothetical protein
MISRRLSALALVLATFAGCHEDPTVQQVIVPGAATALAIFTDGGTGSTPDNAAGTGSAGGSITAHVTGDLNLGGSTTLVAPTVPTAPTTGNPPLTSPSTGTPPGPNGTIFISGIVSVDIATPTATFQTTNGDIVVDGTLQTVIAGGTQNNITLSAPFGTVFVTGSIIASSSDGTPSGDFGGKVSINAARIVVTGTIDTRGENGPAVGGNGGTVMMTSTGSIIVTGSILTAGGTGTTGGVGGDVTLTAGTSLQLFGNVASDGGAATDTVATPAGGNGGNLTLAASSSVDVSSTMTQTGGNATGGPQGAKGGLGGSFSVNGFVPVKIYGTLDLRGGTASAASIGIATLAGGAGGAITLGTPPGPLMSLELGRGTWSATGGSGIDGVGGGGAIDLEAEDGNVSLGSILATSGGSATGAGNTQGGKGGSVTIMGDSTANAKTNHPLVVNFLASVTTTGGAGTGTGNGGQGGGATFQCGGDITLPIVITTTGGAAVNGTGGQAGAIAITVKNLGITALGNVLMTGVLMAVGGASTNGPGGGGGAVTVDTTAAKIGEITSSATVTTSGTSGLVGVSAGGVPGAIQFTTTSGKIDLSGNITANGGDSIAAPATTSPVLVSAGTGGGGITSSATIAASGGNSLAGSAVPVAGGSCVVAAITFRVLNSAGSIQLNAGTSITVNGGAGTGSSNGGDGGAVTLTTLDQSISISGSIVARGGNQSGTASGGMGGQVVVNSDSDNAGGKGDITLNSDGSIDVSSGSGPAGGSARSNLGGPVNPFTALGRAAIAVIFVAEGGFAAPVPQPEPVAPEGVVQNLGTITAVGFGFNGNGGDVYFDGLKPDRITPLTAADAGAQNLSGSGGLTGTFQPN